MKPNPEAMKAKLARARSAVDQGITYKLGKGGVFPNAKLPSNPFKQCDCSGFVAWVLGISRVPKPSRRWWIETTNIYRDAIGPQTVFARIPEPVPGCVVVFPDREGHEGHVGIVSQSYPLRVVDCGSPGITERGGGYFERNHAIYCVLAQDLIRD